MCDNDFGEGNLMASEPLAPFPILQNISVLIGRITGKQPIHTS